MSKEELEAVLNYQYATQTPRGCAAEDEPVQQAARELLPMLDRPERPCTTASR